MNADILEFRMWIFQSGDTYADVPYEGPQFPSI